MVGCLFRNSTNVVVLLVMTPCSLIYTYQNFFLIKPNRRNNFSNLFCHETLHISGSSSASHQEFIHCTLSNGIYHTCLQAAFEQDEAGTQFQNTVPAWSCSKYVEFHGKINLRNYFVCLVLLKINLLRCSTVTWGSNTYQKFQCYMLLLFVRSQKNVIPANASNICPIV